MYKRKVEGLDRNDEYEIYIESDNGTMKVGGNLAEDETVRYNPVNFPDNERINEKFYLLKLEIGRNNTIVIRNKNVSYTHIRLGAKATGIDLSDNAINYAQNMAKELEIDTRFICSDIYELPNVLDDKFDIVFTSYGVIGWLPDLKEWAKVAAHFLKPGGQFIMVEFHPVVWMFDDDFSSIDYSYFKGAEIIEQLEGSYACLLYTSRCV